MKRNIIILVLIILAIFIAYKGVDIQTVDEYYQSHLDDIKPDSKTVSLSIRCDTVLNNLALLPAELKSDEFIPPDGVVLPKTQYVLREGDSVFDILIRATRHKKIQLEYLGNPDKGQDIVYIKGIHYLYEFSCGPLSGWMFKVNGKFSNGNCSEYVLKDGDEIEWVYSCDLGRDVGNNYGEESGE
jgi:hypothetical protein